MEVIVGLLVVAAIVFYLVSKKKKKAAPIKAAAQVTITKEEANTENIKVAGLSYRLDGVKSLGELNDDYNLDKAEIKKKYPDKTIYEWSFPEYPARFEFEPENEADPNAIAIYVDNVKIGYVKKGSTAHIRNLINSGVIEKVTCRIYGGSYKCYNSEMEEFENEKGELSAKVTIYKKS